MFAIEYLGELLEPLDLFSSTACEAGDVGACDALLEDINSFVFIMHIISACLFSIPAYYICSRFWFKNTTIKKGAAICFITFTTLWLLTMYITNSLSAWPIFIMGHIGLALALTLKVNRITKRSSNGTQQSCAP